MSLSRILLARLVSYMNYKKPDLRHKSTMQDLVRKGLVMKASQLQEKVACKRKERSCTSAPLALRGATRDVERTNARGATQGVEERQPLAAYAAVMEAINAAAIEQNGIRMWWLPHLADPSTTLISHTVYSCAVVSNVTLSLTRLGLTLRVKLVPFQPSPWLVTTV